MSFISVLILIGVVGLVGVAAFCAGVFFHDKLLSFFTHKKKELKEKL